MTFPFTFLLQLTVFSLQEKTCLNTETYYFALLLNGFWYIPAVICIPLSLPGSFSNLESAPNTSTCWPVLQCTACPLHPVFCCWEIYSVLLQTKKITGDLIICLCCKELVKNLYFILDKETSFPLCWGSFISFPLNVLFFWSFFCVFVYSFLTLIWLLPSKYGFRSSPWLEETSSLMCKSLVSLIATFFHRRWQNSSTSSDRPRKT